MNAFTIKDLENLSGIKAHTIRVWEQRYSFLNPQRTKTNIRSYSNAELQIVLNIALLNKYGYKISHIDRMTSDEINEKIVSLSQAEAQQERLINGLIHAMVEMDTSGFEAMIDDNVKTNGVEKTIIRIIFPFLERIGILWLTNHINPAQEHLVSNLIRQKLILGIEKLPMPAPGARSAILFLPEGEYHELGLLFMYYILKSKGVKVFYLGTNVPTKDVVFVAEHKAPHFLYTHLTSVAHNFNFGKFLLSLQTHLPGKTVIISGMHTRGYTSKPPANISLKRSLSEVMDYMTSL